MFNTLMFRIGFMKGLLYSIFATENYVRSTLALGEGWKLLEEQAEKFEKYKDTTKRKSYEQAIDDVKEGTLKIAKPVNFRKIKTGDVAEPMEYYKVI